jgi:hypothetical protein
MCVTVRNDRIELSLPDDERVAGVARIVVGGLAARLNASFASLDDLQLAVESILRDWGDPGATTTVEIEIHDGGMALAIGPLRAEDRPSRSSDVGGTEILSAVVDDHRLVERDDGRWVLIEKGMPWISRP